MKRFQFICVFVLSLALVSCGGDKKKEDEKESVKIGTKKETKKSDSNAVTVALSGDDLMQYDKTEIRVKAGQKVTLNFRHTGKGDIKIMGHNFVLLKPDTDINAFALAAANAGEPSDWIPDGGKDVIVHTKMIGGGQSTSITFDAPAAGTYDFVCSFTGHVARMKGKFIVE
ncbi:plastocyanin/azurin family copper-binding protein [Aureisphaera galaxeae]|uniref:plastocyanin/azurin family copper-binding protein n=1 Tax=Aureisphaera galaxeae TaxID=1538023 RepID=UPI00234FFF9F|nr:plastocyanin/azurin family copper-binding protein [Aureisphaera galaxeae]MDC8005324.1 plastocyanin/azurin family copper-binding protein [Aureisphaera galaxeae]